MSLNNFYFKDKLGKDIYVYKWTPESSNIKGVVQIAHGMAEHAGRYDDFAKFLNKNGYIVYADDHRGHGKTSPNELGYMGDGDVFHLMVNNLKDLTDIIKKENPNLPVFLLGHSMGSFISLRYSELYGNELKALILSGSNGKQNLKFSFGALVAKIEMKRKGPKAPATLMDRLSFGSFNSKFKPNRTNCDWLTRNTDEVDKYIKDKLCGSIHSTSYFYYLLKGLKKNYKYKNLNNIPKNLPILLASGKSDPVGMMGQGVKNLQNSLRNAGVKKVDMILYDNARHEILNEINKEEVYSDMINFLNKNRI
ncbi:MAG: alpha/beta hydrolase [Clostridium argentinense]|uniref:Alpha/beta hydrolase n=1 Tax=Clostridium faecium TaxID=2762223 RepID=A0ABR8YVQ1_9CLOT|nr:MULTISPECIES: alpha/beta hydrolase [Clostridium]MBD8048320.1 alpha/beta hydrolase [Clostridium faecium]MBS5822805.1 alpha/beta hydrolase [Clostridium argentinense]MDU1349673.1 alpha/beta hydrolase [Clostridium argentinense]